MSDLGKLTKKVGALLARTEAAIANNHAVGDALIERADVVQAARAEDLDRQRQMLATESAPHKMRGIEQLYLSTLTEHARARRVGRYERDRRSAREGVVQRRESILRP